MAQYDSNPAAGMAGMIYDSGPARRGSFAAESNLPFGVGLVRGTAANQCDLPSASSKLSDFVGVSMHQHSTENAFNLAGELAYQVDEAVSVGEEGRYWVNVEHAVAPGDRVYMRKTAPGSEQVGEFRADGDGTAKVVTITPAAANSTDYRLQIKLDDGRSFEYEITSDGTATATEIADAFRTAIDAEAELDGLLTTSGAATLVLTGDLGVDFQVTSSDSAGTLAVALTTALDSECMYLPNARWVVAGSSVAALELN